MNSLDMFLIATKLMNVICWSSILGTVKLIAFTVQERESTAELLIATVSSFSEMIWPMFVYQRNSRLIMIDLCTQGT